MIFIMFFMLLFDFSPESDLNNWQVVDDVVMGGRSDGQFSLNEQGHGVFEGRVSLENNGGFSSVRHRFESKSLSGQQKFVLRLKGDGKRYQFRAKTSQSDRHSYIYYFETTGDWQTVEIPFQEMYPAFRGRKLKLPNFPGEQAAEIAFLIGNKKAETFKLVIDKVSVEQS